MKICAYCALTRGPEPSCPGCGSGELRRPSPLKQGYLYKGQPVTKEEFSRLANESPLAWLFAPTASTGPR